MMLGAPEQRKWTKIQETRDKCLDTCRSLKEDEEEKKKMRA